METRDIKISLAGAETLKRGAEQELDRIVAALEARLHKQITKITFREYKDSCSSNSDGGFRITINI